MENIFPESACDPFIVSNGSRLGFCFLAMKENNHGQLERAGFALVRSETCLIYKSGYPNDEARAGQQFRDGTPDLLEIQQITNSPWLKQLNPPHAQEFKHWLFPFKETTLELLARDLQIELLAQDYHSCQMMLVEWVEQ